MGSIVETEREVKKKKAKTNNSKHRDERHRSIKSLRTYTQQRAFLKDHKL